jgi:hypothetical protein
MLERSLGSLRPLNEPRVLVETLAYLGIVTEANGNYSKKEEQLTITVHPVLTKV